MAARTSAVVSMPLLAEPSESWSYSVGFDILGDLVYPLGIFLFKIRYKVNLSISALGRISIRSTATPGG
ncbi:MAG: hypothetical protein ACI955_000619 [Zhongshania sp.]|jgi:hypothetical protein